MTSPSSPVGCLFRGAESALQDGFVPAFGALILVSLDEVTSHVGVMGDPTLAWYHLTRHLIDNGTHPSELLWGVVLCHEDAKHSHGFDREEGGEE